MTDSELIAAYRRGDLAAFEQLVARHRAGLYGYIMNMTGNRADADDVFQEVWLRALKKLRLFRRKQNFGGWLTRIARNLVIDRARKRSADVSLDAESDSGISMLTLLADGDPGPAAAVHAGDIGRRIASAVAALPMDQREVFVLRMSGGLPFKEIAGIQGVSINTALGRMQYALARLRPLLQGDYEALGKH